jgi:hypothetical protein
MILIPLNPGARPGHRRRARFWHREFRELKLISRCERQQIAASLVETIRQQGARDARLCPAAALPAAGPGVNHRGSTFGCTSGTPTRRSPARTTGGAAGWRQYWYPHVP